MSSFYAGDGQTWRVKYDKDTDRFLYERYDEETDSWNLVSTTKCVRREGAEEDEGTDYIHISFLTHIVGEWAGAERQH